MHNNEELPSLFFPKLAAILLLAIFLSGMVEIVFLVRCAEKSHYSIANETSQLLSKPDQVIAPNVQLTNQIEIN